MLEQQVALLKMLVGTAVRQEAVLLALAKEVAELRAITGAATGIATAYPGGDKVVFQADEANRRAVCVLPPIATAQEGGLVLPQKGLVQP